jgi:hypothetical protein
MPRWRVKYSPTSSPMSIPGALVPKMETSWTFALSRLKGDGLSGIVIASFSCARVWVIVSFDHVLSMAV